MSKSKEGSTLFFRASGAKTHFEGVAANLMVLSPLPPPPSPTFDFPDAWPVVVDEFVEKMLAQKKASTSETERP